MFPSLDAPRPSKNQYLYSVNEQISRQISDVLHILAMHEQQHKSSKTSVSQKNSNAAASVTLKLPLELGTTIMLLDAD
jgi:hypothetical protein